jgi:thiamine biosynthesis lipoprotein
MTEKNKDNDNAGQPANPLPSQAKMAAIIVLIAAVGWMMLKSYLFKPEMYETSGDTMGTKYYVKICAESSWGWERTQAAVETELLRVNQMMSTFIEDSEISKFNDNPSTDWISVSPEMVKLVKLSKEVSEIVDGKFDITIGPLVDLWGFGRKSRKLAIPPHVQDIMDTRLICGLDKLEYRESPPALMKTVPELRIDLSGVAKGYGVDCVAAMLEKRGYTNYLIEIGGETRSNGHKVVLQESQGWMSMFSAEKLEAPWLIGIQEPVPVEQFENPNVVMRVNLNDRAMATSGDAHSTKEIGGRRYTHIIDPRSGYAVSSEEHGTGVEGEEIGSVSVIADTCAEADALATGFYLLGVERGIASANLHKLAVVYLIRTSDLKKPIRAVISDAFEKNYSQSN